MITHSEKYEEYIIDDPNKGIYPIGEQSLYKFPNGYGASVIYSTVSYGLEIAVIEFTNDGEFSITYETPLTDDVVGYVEDLDEVLDDIFNLQGDIQMHLHEENINNALDLYEFYLEEGFSHKEARLKTLNEFTLTLLEREVFYKTIVEVLEVELNNR